MDFNHKCAAFSKYCSRVSAYVKGVRHSKSKEMNQQRNSRVHWKPIVFLAIFGLSAVLCGAQAINYRQTNETRGTLTPTPSPETTLPPATPAGSDTETQSSQAVFFIMGVLGLCTMMVYFLIKFKFHYLPESIVVVLIGVIIGLIFFIIKKSTAQDLKYLEQFQSNSFFLILLPPIIFESGYSLHKGDFFQNIGSILVFAVIGTAISAFIIGGVIFGLGKIEVVPTFGVIESFAFGSLISAVDPVATLAIFHALDVDPTLNMLVFGESVLNDAVSIVMFKTVIDQAHVTSDGTYVILLKSLGKFLLMFGCSALIGAALAICSALLTKHIALRRHPSLELPMILIFAFLPYFIAEGLNLSGIMAVLFSGIVMAHYTHYNLSPVTQVTIQQTLRSVAFMAETCVFVYLGLAIFAIRHRFNVSLVIWSILLCLIGRAFNIFPLMALVNKFRSVKINRRMQFIMWFSGLRGAIAFALALNLEEYVTEGIFSEENYHYVVTTTLVIVLFTIVFLGGSTLPLLKLLKAESDSTEDVTLSKTEELGTAVTVSLDDSSQKWPSISVHGFSKLDYRFISPFLTRRFTRSEVREARIEMQKVTNAWYSGVREVSSDEEELMEGDHEQILEEEITEVDFQQPQSSPKLNNDSMELTTSL
ncbi:sodium/hydrogen exchanger 8-like [Dysidea avara]|uniref:sodium/hydrogen exchanger 8-like n=1 Tax=Dysidea avara TaxID=196820 RepID=UPI003327544C